MKHNWDHINDLLAQALARTGDERTRFLDEIGDPSLRIELESLLSASDETGLFLAGDALSAHPSTDLDQDRLIGQSLGVWRVESKIGEGGMGTVYQASRHDEHYTAQAAVKVLRPGISSSFTVNRFRTERQILARLSHPNIARMLDGGATDDGRPYFVMELVSGLPLDEYCDNRKLSVLDRLKLFLDVCSAVQYAHANLIVHRDLKPTNILVTEDGVVKLLDFGIAKILNPSESSEYAQNTMAMVRMMTPDYASPEQIRGEMVTTASDVYALGVVLYELLSGHHPYRRSKKAPHELERLICEVDPERPSSAVKWVETVTDRKGSALVLTPEWVSGAREGRPDRLVRRLRGDLDNIVLRAMKKDPAKRYESAGQLADDIRRYLADEPVIARADTPLYRASKFVSRHKAGVAATAATGLVLLGGTVVTLREARIAREERARAERRFNDVRHLAHSFLFEFHDAIKDLPGSTAARALVVRKASAYLDSLARESANDDSLQRELAEAYEKLSDAQGSWAEASLGETANGLLSIQKALPLREELARRHPKNVDDQMGLATAYARAASVLADVGRAKEAGDYWEKAFRVREQIFAEHPTDLKIKRSLAVGYWDLGVAFADRGAYRESLQARLKALTLFEEVRNVNPSRNNRRSVALLHKNLAATYTRLYQFQPAIEHAQKAIEIDQSLVNENRQEVLARRDLAFSLSEMGEALTNLKHPREALDYYERSLELRQEIVREDPKDQPAMYALGNMQFRLGSAHYNLHDKQESLKHHLRALEIRSELYAHDPVNVKIREVLAESHEAVGTVYADLGDQARARARYQQSIAILTELRNDGKITPLGTAILAEVQKKHAEH